MLVLSRKRGESIYVGPQIEIRVVRIGPNSVRLGITAPPEYSITRDQAYQEVEIPLSTVESNPELTPAA